MVPTGPQACGLRTLRGLQPGLETRIPATRRKGESQHKSTGSGIGRVTVETPPPQAGLEVHFRPTTGLFLESSKREPFRPSVSSLHTGFTEWLCGTSCQLGGWGGGFPFIRHLCLTGHVKTVTCADVQQRDRPRKSLYG